MAVHLALVLAGLAGIVGVNVLARRIGLPPAVLLVLAGLIYAVAPGPNISLRPDVVLILVIPPLLYGTALNSSAIALRGSARTVTSLSVGLVLATALTVGAVLSAVIPSLPFDAALALGAAVAPPDPVAALAVSRRAGLPPRLLTAIEGEGLLNDAMALILLSEAVSSATGGGFSPGGTVLRFVLAAAGGGVAGVVVAFLAGRLRMAVGEPLGETALSLATPFAAYLLADTVRVSGVLAVVVAGLWSAHRSPLTQRSDSRLQARAVWRLVEYLLEGFVFLLIGQQLPAVLRGLGTYSVHVVVVGSALTVGALVGVRFAWLFGGSAIGRLRHALSKRPDVPEHLSRRELTVLGWAGTRGVITLAAVFSLPLVTHGGSPFPYRDLLLFLAYLAVLVTLIGQGVTLEPLVRRLGVRGSHVGPALVRNQARAAAVRAAVEGLEETTRAERLPDALVEPLRRQAKARLERYEGRVKRLSTAEDGEVPADDPYFVTARLRRAMIAMEREVIIEWRDSGRLEDASLRILQRELDYEEGLLPVT